MKNVGLESLNTVVIAVFTGEPSRKSYESKRAEFRFFRKTFKIRKKIRSIIRDKRKLHYA